MKSLWRALLIQILCLRHDIHDTGLARSGTCQRCHLPIGEDGNAL